jgi:carbon-monoxide dehydrogenase large subunit
VTIKLAAAGTREAIRGADTTTWGPYRGHSVPRIEDSRLIRGQGQYVDDFTTSNVAFAEIVRSPLPHAHIRSIDTSAAAALPGVLGVFTGHDVVVELHALLPVIAAGVPNRRQTPPQYPIAIDEAVYEGEPVAIVVADTRYGAADAAELVAVDYEPLPAVHDMDKAIVEGSPVAHTDGPDNIGWDVTLPIEGNVDVDAAFAGAAVTVTQRIVQQRVCAASIECRSVLADYRDRLTVWNSSQMPHFNRMYVAEGLGLPESKVRFISPDVGGAFGSKMGPYAEDYLIPIASKLVGRPVKWTETRSENLSSTSHGRGQVFDIEAAAAADGTLVAMRIKQLVDIGAYFGRTGANPIVSVQLSGGCYRWPVIEARSIGVLTNKMWTGPYRGAGRPEATHLVERVMDLLAHELHMDPVEIRRRNFITEFPYKNNFGFTYDSGDYHAALECALDTVDYPAFRARQADLRAKGRYLGIGIGSYVEISGFGPSSETAADDHEIGLTESAVVRIHPSGAVSVFAGTHSHGQGHATSFAQIAADALGVPIADVDVVEGDTSNTPFGHGTYGSRSVPVGGMAVYTACQRIIDKGKAIVAHLLQSATENISFNLGVFTDTVTGRTRSIKDVSLASYNRGLPEGIEQGMEATAFFDPPNFTWPFGTHICEVEVDTRTGVTDILRYVAVDDCGNIINPMLVEGQIQGGVLQGVAQALLEEVQYSAEDGQRLGGTFLDYLIPTMNEMVPTEVHHTVTPTSTNSLGVKGVGEAGTIASSVAVINAICDALAPLGIHHVEMPASPQRLWHLIHDAEPADAH